MTTRRLRILCTSVVPWVATASLLAAPIGQPTPCPCTADGACVPARATWGYHRTQWRLWPGTTLDEGRPGEEPAVGENQIGPTAPPDPRVEDKQAPPKVEALDPQAAEESRATDRDFELPEAERPTGDTDGAPAPDPLQPPRPGFMDRPPGGLPFDTPADESGATEPDAGPELPFGQPPSAPLDTPRPPADLFPSNSREQPVGPRFGGDAPPALPMAIQPQSKPATRRPPVTGFVLPASASGDAHVNRPTASRIPVQVNRQRVERAAALSHVGDAPPHMPAGIFGAR